MANTSFTAATEGCVTGHTHLLCSQTAPTAALEPKTCMFKGGLFDGRVVETCTPWSERSPPQAVTRAESNASCLLIDPR